MNSTMQFDYAKRFLDTYFSIPAGERDTREAECLKLQFSECFMAPEGSELLMGKYDHPCVGFGLQESGMGFFMNRDLFQRMEKENPQHADEIKAIREKWAPETGYQQLLDQTPQRIMDVIPYEDFNNYSNVGYWLCRMSSTHLDFDKLLTLGVSGLKTEILKHMKENPEPDAQTLYRGFLRVLDAFSFVARACADKAEASDAVYAAQIAANLRKIAENKPDTFWEAVQLMYLYAIMSGTYNYGRLDEYLGDFYVNDLKNGILTEDMARDILISLWKLMIHRKTTWNARVFVGGKGRRNEVNADRLALMCIKVASIVKDVLPQFSLRFFKGQNPELLDEAYRVIGQGCVYPILYNDDVNVPAVMKTFRVSEKEAEQYIPYGCGEYILYHRTVGTPSDIINLLKALEVTLHNGYDPESGKMIGLKTGEFKDMPDFDTLYAAYCRQVERFVEVEAEQQLIEYEAAKKNASFLMAGLLYDDCIARGKPIFDGGALQLGGTLEVYGRTNTSDSLLAIKKLVYDKKIITPEKLLDMLDHDFAGYETERKMLLAQPKFGNDDDEADEMAALVHEHICRVTEEQAERFRMATYLVVVINNSANSTLGLHTGASADGRCAHEPMANANNPSGGCDKNGLTAMLNSLLKMRCDIHAGSVQNIKFSKEMFKGEKMQKTRAILDTYFDNGGTQLMINVLGRDDLENALREPEKYQNLIVRVGGFCARFVELSNDVQREILSRTMY